jgi:hypothetical protein
MHSALVLGVEGDAGRSSDSGAEASGSPTSREKSHLCINIG